MITISALVIALTALVKKTNWIKGEYLPLVAIGFSVLLVFSRDFWDVYPQMSEALGYGLGATGLYAGTTDLIEKSK